MNDFFCKIPTIEEMERKWNYQIATSSETNRANWIFWKKEAILHYQKGDSISYYGILNDEIICEATAMLNPDVVQNSKDLVDDVTAYLCAFRTIPDQQGQGYFSKLFCYMIDDLKERGFTKVTLGVEPNEQKNLEIYQHYGFTEYIKRGIEQYPDGTTIQVDYYAKTL